MLDAPSAHGNQLPFRWRGLEGQQLFLASGLVDGHP